MAGEPSVALLDAFQPTVRTWFMRRFSRPSPAQEMGWPAIGAGKHTLIAAPTGSGKTLAAFLFALDEVLAQGNDLPEQTQVLYVSPLKALGNDVQKNLQGPLTEMQEIEPRLPDVRVLVRSGDTPQSVRAAMRKKPPHILVTTPESLYILLTSDSGREMLRTVKTVIVDEIHAVLGSKRGSHLALSLERLAALAGDIQRIGLSATQKPLTDVSRFLVGPGRECTLVDAGHRRELDLALELPPSPLTPVCSHETWSEIYRRISELIAEHSTTLVFCNTRKLAERTSRHLAEIVGEDLVGCHHSSLAKDRRLNAETRLKEGSYRALVATASLELGIDVGDVDLVVQVGSTRSIATFLQRVGRSGHTLGKTPKGRVFPLTRDELIEAAALLRSVRRGELDRTPQPRAPLDILAQQMVAACVAEDWDEDELFEAVRKSWPYRDLERSEFDQVVAMHVGRRESLLHRDAVGNRLRATKRARITAITSGGAIPDNADYQVILEPEGTKIGTVNEDFAIESSVGDVFQLGNASWQLLKHDRGILRVADAKGAPPSLPFWFGEAPSRTRELSSAIGELRKHGKDPQWLQAETGIPAEAATEIAETLAEGERALGAIPTRECMVLERFFDESGGMQLVLHSLFGGRINRALGLALRKRFCRSFGFELQAAANEEAIVLSLGHQHSFDLADVFDYVAPHEARRILEQAVLPRPMFTTRWRWNASRSLLVERMRGGKRVPAPLVRMRADDLLTRAFPSVVACGETLPPGDLEIPRDEPMVRQTVEDCLHEAMDFDGLLEVLEGLKDGSIRRVAVDTAEPSVFCQGILNAQPYMFLDDAPLEERRTQAVLQRRGLDQKTSDEIGELDPMAVERVRGEAWPGPENADEVHEALTWMGFVGFDEAAPWSEWLQELCAAGRVVREPQGWFAVEATRDPKEVLRGRMEALGPVFSDDPLMRVLESEGVLLRARLEGRQAWCHRRLLARIQRYTLDKLRQEIEPVAASDFLRFLAVWQHATPETRLDGPRGVAEVLKKLAGYEVPAAAWERHVLPLRVRDFRREWLDEVLLSGELAWGRLWGSGSASLRTAPLTFVAREDLAQWLGLSTRVEREELSGTARVILETLDARGAMFPQELARASELLPSYLELGLAELICRGAVTGDSFAGVRQMLTPPSKRRRRVASVGRWSPFRHREEAAPEVEFVVRRLLARTGILFRKMLERERMPVRWRDLLPVLRGLELRGELRGGRFVARFDGEQYALPEAVPVLRRVRRDGAAGHAPLSVSAADPLNYRGILTPDSRIAPQSREQVALP